VRVDQDWYIISTEANMALEEAVVRTLEQEELVEQQAQ
jgi:hypothetical protein